MKSCTLKCCLLACCLLVSTSAFAQSPKTKSGFVRTSDGAEIHYLEAGTPVRAMTRVGTLPPIESQVWPSPAILFVPGWTMPAWVWEHQIAHFAKTHRVVAMDPRGQGESSKPRDGYFPAARALDIKAVIDELKLAPVVLVGWSMGVNEITAYVDQFGTEGLAGIVLVDGIAGGYDSEMLATISLWAGSILKDREKQTAALLRSMLRNPEVQKNEAYIQRLVRAALQTPTDATVALLVGAATSDFRPALPKIDKPTLLVTAPNPRFDPLYTEMAGSIPGARHEVFAEAGHLLFVEEPARFNSLLDDFLRALK